MREPFKCDEAGACWLSRVREKSELAVIARCWEGKSWLLFQEELERRSGVRESLGSLSECRREVFKCEETSLILR